MGKKFFGEITISFSANGTLKKVVDMITKLDTDYRVIEKLLSFIGVEIKINDIEVDYYDVEEVEEIDK